MIWQNYDRLVQHLRTCDPAKFNYGDNNMSSHAGCVACHVIRLVGRDESLGGFATINSIADFLGVPHAEACYLYGSVEPGFDADPIGYNAACGDDRFHRIKHGELGIAEALRRLAIVAARYSRPVETEAPKLALPTFQPNEQAFLDSSRSLVASAEIGR